MDDDEIVAQVVNDLHRIADAQERIALANEQRNELLVSEIRDREERWDQERREQAARWASLTGEETPGAQENG